MVAYPTLAAKRGLWSHTLVYGDSKSGKTTLVLELLKSYKLIWINLDNGVYLPAAKLSADNQANLDVINIPDTNTAPIAYSLVKRLIEGRSTRICNEHFIADCGHCAKNAATEFTTYEFNQLGADTIVVIDHITKASMSALGHICLDDYKKAIQRDPLNMYKPKLDDWGALSYNVGQFMTAIQNARFNIVAIAQSQEQETEDGRKKLLPNFGSKEFGRNVANFFDHMVFCELEMNKHKFGSMTNYGMHCMAGSRSDIDISKMSPASLVPFFMPPSTVVDRSAVDMSTVPTVGTGAASSTVSDKQSADALLESLMAGMKAK